MLRAIVFAILDCGFVPRCAAEIDDGAQIRIDKIFRIIEDCKFAVHDLSRTELDENTGLPRFNMPLELGIFLGAKRFGERKHKYKNCLILDTEQYRYQAFISDISGQDIKAHENNPELAVTRVRSWLQTASSRRTIPGGAAIWRRYQEFTEKLPDLCAEVDLEIAEMTYTDLVNFAGLWLKETAPQA